MNSKNILATLLLTSAVITTGAVFASDDTETNDNSAPRKCIELTDEQKADLEEFKTLMNKVRDGEILTEDEETRLEELKESVPTRGPKGGKMRGGKMGFQMVGNLTDEEKEALESMTDEEKQEFFQTKREEQEAIRESHEDVIDKVLNGETLTDEEEAILDEIKEKRAEAKEKRAEMEEFRELNQKVNSGETLTDEEQERYDEIKESFPSRGKN